MAGDPEPDPMDCINRGIASHNNAAVINTRAQQIIARTFGRCKMQVSDVSDEGPVDLFRKWRQPIVGSQPCLHVAHCDTMIERRRSSYHRGCCVALNKNPVGSIFRKKIIELIKEPRCETSQRL